MNALLKRMGTLETAPPWGMGAVILTFVGAFAAIIVGTFFGFAVFGEEVGYGLLAGWTISMGLTVALVLQTRRRDHEWLKLEPPITPLPLILFVAFGFAVAVDLIGLAVTRDTGLVLTAPELSNFGVMGVADWLFAIVFMVIAQPIAEELVFRGVALPALRGLLGAWAGLVVTALVYALFHLLAYPANPTYAPLVGFWIGLIQPFLAGIVIGAVRASTGSTRAAIIAHAAFGLFAVLKLVLLASG